MPQRLHGVSRLEGFSDAVFGFALTLLVVSLETPKDHQALMTLMRGFLPFALTFAMICWLWYEHNVFFRRYGLQDPWTVFLNSVLLFVVLFYVYPLRYLATTLVEGFSGNAAALQSMDGQLTMLMYSGGVVLIFTTFLLLHRHAWNQRTALGLSAVDVLRLRYGARAHGISAAIGVVSIILALASARWAGLAGMIYIVMGPLHAWNGFVGGKAIDTLTKASGAPPTLAPEA